MGAKNSDSVSRINIAEMLMARMTKMNDGMNVCKSENFLSDLEFNGWSLVLLIAVVWSGIMPSPINVAWDISSASIPEISGS